MKLVLKNGIEIVINNVNNRKNLTVDVNGKNPDQQLIFSIFNASKAIVFEDLIKLVTSNNKDFYVLYGDGQKQTYPGWVLSDLAEEITEEQRKITLFATKSGV